MPRKVLRFGFDHPRSASGSRFQRSAQLAGSVCLLVFGGCDDSFSPLASGGIPFAVHGVLDAGADTQWIRVTPLRMVVPTSSDPIGVTVTLQKAGENSNVELLDSVFSFAMGDSSFGSGGVYVHNFWTAERIEPAAEYRLSLQRADHPPAQIAVTIPADYEVEVWRGSSRVPPRATRIELLGVKHVPFVTATAMCGGGKALYYLAPSRTGPDAHRVTLPGYLDNCNSVEFTMVGSELEWPAGHGYSLARLTEGAGNYSDALGFVGGVLTRTIPYENCEFVDGGAPQPEYCILRYNATSATISGTVTEMRCGDVLLGDVNIELRQLDPVPPAVAQKRTTVTSPRYRGYSIGALVPAVRYAMRAWVDIEPWFAIYSVHTDTLVFQPGERLTYDVGLELLSPCPEPSGRAAGGQP